MSLLSHFARARENENRLLRDFPLIVVWTRLLFECADGRFTIELKYWPHVFFLDEWIWKKRTADRLLLFCRPVFKYHKKNTKLSFSYSGSWCFLFRSRFLFFFFRENDFICCFHIVRVFSLINLQEQSFQHRPLLVLFIISTSFYTRYVSFFSVFDNKTANTQRLTYW